MTKDKVIFLVGPTAVGKTEAAICLAKKLNAEIISCDSMQVYKGMRITSSQPSAYLRRAVPQHLIARVPPTKEYNVSKYRQDAIKKIKQIIKKGKTPIFAGGTGLYMSILIDGIFKAKSKNTIRKRLYRQTEIFGNQFLYDKLKNIDPEAALKIHLNDTKRMVRALEVFETTGKPISYLQKQRKGLTDNYEVKIFCLNMERNKLYRRIKNRVNKMFASGLVKEVKRLVNKKLSKTARCAIGIKELRGYFDGLYDLEEAKRLIERHTCVYVKKQLTWFKKDKRIKWIEVGEKEKPESVARRIWKELY